MTFPKFVVRPLAVAALLAAAGASQAAITVYSTQATFLAAVTAPGVDTFNDLALSSAPSPILRTAGPYSYTGSVSTTSFFQAGTSADVWLSTNTATDTITFNTFSAGVRAIGGNFFGSDINGSFIAGDLSLVATDASGSVTQTLLSPTTSTFLGFVSSGPLVSLTVCVLQPGTSACGPGTTPTSFVWPTVNNLTLAQAGVVPEPGTYALMACGLGMLGFMARRRRG